jgi:hypothetical protein
LFRLWESGVTPSRHPPNPVLVNYR